MLSDELDEVDEDGHVDEGRLLLLVCLAGLEEGRLLLLLHQLLDWSRAQ